MQLDSSVSAVITGGASGLGAATAIALRALGVKVALFDINVEKGEAFAREIGATFVKVDVTSDAEVDAGFATARAANGQERIMVNCAGRGKSAKTAGRDKATGEIKRYPMEWYNAIIQLNLVASFRCASASAAGMLTLPAMEPDGERGLILFTSSVAAQDGQMGQCAYSSSKAGLVGMTITLARDFMSEGIRVNTILPGIFETPLMLGAQPKVLEALAASVPFPKRLGRPPEYASLALEMMRNVYFNGESVRLDGAIRMAPR